MPILLGGAAGFLLGHYLVRLAGWLLLSTSGDVPLSAGADRWADVVALGGAVLAALFAQRVELAKKTLDLLRNPGSGTSSALPRASWSPPGTGASRPGTDG